MGISYAKYLVSPQYRKFPFKGIIGWALANRPPSVEDLQSKYEFRYYSTMVKAVTDVNNGTTANADAEKGTAVAGVYTDENGGKNVVLLKDHTESASVKPSVDMTINLGGRALTFNGDIGINVLGGIVVIDGKINGSAVKAVATSIDNTKAIKVDGGMCSIDGGSYECYSSVAKYSIAIACYNASLSVSDARIFAFDDTATYVYGIQAAPNAAVIVSDCDICAKTTNGTSRGIYNYQGNINLADCAIKAYSNYTYDDNGLGAASEGVQNKGKLTLRDCYVMGTHSGVGNNGALTVNGGIYEGYGHGGFYFSGAGTTSYVRDAVIRECAMPDGYTATANCNGSGFYIGGNADANNITVNMDNCDIYSSASQIVLRGSAGEQNNSLYISNSNVYDMDGDNISIRIDHDTHKLYIGAGNNFTAENTSLPEAVVVTDDVYREAV